MDCLQWAFVISYIIRQPSVESDCVDQIKCTWLYGTRWDTLYIHIWPVNDVNTTQYGDKLLWFENLTNYIIHNTNY